MASLTADLWKNQNQSPTILGPRLSRIFMPDTDCDSRRRVGVWPSSWRLSHCVLLLNQSWISKCDSRIVGLGTFSSPRTHRDFVIRCPRLFLRLGRNICWDPSEGYIFHLSHFSRRIGSSCSLSFYPILQIHAS